jgi:hypothetical protein
VLVTGAQPITNVTQRITICELRYSLGLIGSVRRVTGAVRVGFRSLDKQFTASIKDLTGVIDSFEAFDHARSSQRSVLVSLTL